MIGRTLGHYSIVERIGAGGMGVVYRAHDQRLDRDVALKLLPEGTVADEVARTRFKKEALALSKLEHPNIATVHDFNTQDGIDFLVMELIAGVSLSEKLRHGPLPEEDVLRLGMQLVEGLKFAHAAGVIHRDIKPSNLLITSDGRLKILDFGLARHQEQVSDVSTTESASSTAGAAGTLPYMSPEQLRNQRVDARSDIYAVGGVLYEMITGQRAFAQKGGPQLIDAILNQSPHPPSELNPRVPPPLEYIVLKALDKSPKHRYQSVDELMVDLERLAAPSTGAAPPPLKLPLRLRLRRWRVAIAIGSSLGLMALIALPFAFRSLKRVLVPSGIRNMAVLPFKNFTGDQARDYFCEGMSSVLIHQLSEFPGINVVSQSEAWTYKGRNKPARQIARELGVEAILEGQVFGVNAMLRVDVQLIDSATGFVTWSKTLNGEQQRIFMLQESLARELAGILSIPLSAEQQRGLVGGLTRSSEAYDLYLQAREFLDRVEEPRGADAAFDLLRQALELDPQFALARADLSEALTKIYDLDREPGLLKNARQEAERALEIDADLPAGRIALARVYRKTGRLTDSIHELRQLVARHPNLDRAYVELATSYEQAGQLDKAESNWRKAISIRPDYWLHWNELGELLKEEADYAGSREALEKAIELKPSEEGWPFQSLASLELVQGNYSAAIEVFDRIPRPINDSILASDIGTAYFYAERLVEAEKYYRLAIRLQPNSHVFHRNLADLFLRQERPEEARQEYRKAAALAEGQLLVNPENEGLQLRRALYLARAGDCEGAVQLASELEVNLSPSPGNSYRIAQTYSVCNEKKLALSAIELAIQRGFSVERIRQDDEFRSLASDPNFRRLVLENDIR